jgi:hypothetical protein
MEVDVKRYSFEICAPPAWGNASKRGCIDDYLMHASRLLAKDTLDEKGISLFPNPFLYLYARHRLSNDYWIYLKDSLRKRSPDCLRVKTEGDGETFMVDATDYSYARKIADQFVSSLEDIMVESIPCDKREELEGYLRVPYFFTTR